jgi:hypothetical protein
MKVDKLIEALAEPDRTARVLGLAAPHHPCFMAGYRDAQRGHTANPYGLAPCSKKWAEGYDFADDNGEALLGPRFGKRAGKRRR